MNDFDTFLDEYYKAFGEGFPMYQLGRGRTDEEVIEIIKKCLEENKDVYALGLVSEDEEVEY